ncbi:MAG: diiron oxygenase [Blastocatellia bacterium]|nr:diiron oxygenase [Blastocatellia bacterium]
MRQKLSEIDAIYRSKLSQWDRIAAVRAKPRRMLQLETICDALVFPISLLPLLRTQAVKRLSPCIEDLDKKMAAQALYLYLEFTDRLELDAVNVVAQKIARREIGFDVGEELAFDAYKVYCDEAYHAYFSIDLKRQVVAATGIDPLEHRLPRFLRVLRAIQERAAPEFRPLIELLFVVIAETLISGNLAQIPADKCIPAAIRDLVADHLEDEGRHHAFFSSFFEFLWPQLHPRIKTAVAPTLPHLILGFLEPDREAVCVELRSYGLASREIQDAMEEAWPRESVLKGARESASATLSLFERNSVFTDAATLDAFHLSQLLKP